MSRTASELKLEDHACSTGDCGHIWQSECDAELNKLDVIECSNGCDGCSCHINPPCSHCVEGHGYITKESL